MAPNRWTREQLEAEIAAHGGPEGLDLSGADLSDSNLTALDLHGIILARWDDEHGQFVSADLSNATLWAANLSGAYLCGVNLSHANLQDADLPGANLAGANLTGASLMHADLSGANMGGINLREADLRKANLAWVDLRDAKNLEGIRLHQVRLDRTYLTRDQIAPAIGDEVAGEYREAQGAYLTLKQNFEGLGDYEAASWSYIKERQMEKICSAPWRARGFYGKEQLGDTDKRKLPWHDPRVWWFFLRHTLKWSSDWVVEAVCKYGEGAGRVVAWMILALLEFAVYYWRIGAVLLMEPDGSKVTATSFWHYLIYSAGAFTTTSFARFQAADDGVRLLTAVQAIIGIFLAGLLGFVAGKRIRRS